VWVWIVLAVVVVVIFYLGGRSLFSTEKRAYDDLSQGGGFMGYRRYRDDPPRDDQET
jgi:hypothetical protein